MSRDTNLSWIQCRDGRSARPRSALSVSVTFQAVQKKHSSSFQAWVMTKAKGAITLEQDLLKRPDALVAAKSFANRCGRSRKQ
jgi:hypothetical protein